jgi:SAM-dependent methyltransferase
MFGMGFHLSISAWHCERSWIVSRPVTEPAHVTETRTAYDTVADSYAEQLRTLLDASPWERAMLGTFAELVGGAGPVGDLGCGPGRLTGYLASLGLDVFGVDLSPGMVGAARRAHPGLRFEVGSLAALDLADGSLAGALAWYSLIHTPHRSCCRRWWPNWRGCSRPADAC